MINKKSGENVRMCRCADVRMCRHEDKRVTPGLLQISQMVGLHLFTLFWVYTFINIL